MVRPPRLRPDISTTGRPDHLGGPIGGAVRNRRETLRWWKCSFPGGGRGDGTTLGGGPGAVPGVVERALRRFAHVLLLGGREGEVEGVARHLQRQRGAGQEPRRIARP